MGHFEDVVLTQGDKSSQWACNLCWKVSSVLYKGFQNVGTYNRSNVAKAYNPVLHRAREIRESLNIWGDHCFSSKLVRNLMSSKKIWMHVWKPNALTNLSVRQMKMTRRHANEKLQKECKTIEGRRTWSSRKDQCKCDSSAIHPLLRNATRSHFVQKGGRSWNRLVVVKRPRTNECWTAEVRYSNPTDDSSRQRCGGQ